MKPDDSFPRAGDGEPSSAANARVTEGIQSRVPDVVGVEGRLFGSKLSPDRIVPLGMRTHTNIAKRKLGLKDAGVARRIVHSIQLPRDRQFIDSLSLGDLLDQSVVNSFKVSYRILN